MALILGGLLSWCAGCTHPREFKESFLATHSINVDRLGAPQLIRGDDIESAHLRHPGMFTSNESMRKAHQQYQEYLRAYRTDLTNLFAEIDVTAPTNEFGKRQILLYAHGGLNTESARLGRIKELLGTGYPGSTNHITNHYVIFLNWESGLFSSYGEHLLTVRQGRKYDFLSPAGMGATPFVLLADLGRLVVNAPSVWYAQLGTDVKSYGKTKSSWQNVASLTEEWKSLNEIDVITGRTNASAADTLYRFGVHLVTLPTKVVFAPVIDGFGEAAWRSMRRRTDTMFRPVYEFDLSYDDRDHNLAAIKAATDEQPTGALAIFLDELSNRWRAGNYEVTVVGHSMGTIVINNILRRYPELPYKRILFMAAACRIKDIETSVIPCLKVHTNLVFQNWCLHRRAEAAERNLFVQFDLVPRGSLLEWIDNYLDSPESFEDRTLGKWENIMQAAHVFPASVRSRVYLKEFGYRVEGEPQRHVEFGNQEFWAEPLRRELETPVHELQRQRRMRQEKQGATEK